MAGDRESERGAALLTVLLLVAVVGALAAVTLEKLNLATRLAGNAKAMDQARAYAMATETMALTRIDALLGGNTTRVTLQGGWSNRPIPLPIPDGVATARVVDGGNCFNLNNLVVPAEQGSFAARTASVIQFARLMRMIGLPADAAARIAASAADWIDSDNAPIANGAEDADYAARIPAYRTANALMSDPSEVRAVVGMTSAIYARLRPWLCTLPTTEPARINVNTLLPEQGALVAALLPDTLTAEQARQMLLNRPPDGYGNPNEFWKQAALQAIAPPPDATAQTAVTTRWFALKITVTIGRITLDQTGLIDAGRPPARLVSRQWGEEG